MRPIGHGKWTAQLVGRGGGPVRLQSPITDFSRNKVINTWGTANVNLARGPTFRTAYLQTQSWRDELVLYRDDELDYAGPITGRRFGSENGTISSKDLFFWMERRFIEQDYFGTGDIADIFNDVFHLAYDKESSPNIDITTRRTGIKGNRTIRASEFQRAADVMRELARTALDFTMVGRRILAGGTEVFLDAGPLLLHDEGVLTADISDNGDIFATDVAVFGGTTVRDQVNPGESRVVHASGRATTGVEEYGLIQQSFTELRIKDNLSADANAEARLDAVQPLPLLITATLSDKTAFSYADLIPGRRFDVRLSEKLGGIEIMQDMRLVTVGVTVGESGESVTIGLVPIGVSDEEA